MATHIARLIVQRGPYEGKSYDLYEPQYVLGRASGNDISLPDPEVSRQHIRLIQQGDSYTIEDLGSTNGTFINGRRLSGSILLQNDDVVGLGETIQLRYQIGDASTGGYSHPSPAAKPAEPATDPNLFPLAPDMPPARPPAPAAQYAPPQPVPAAAPPPIPFPPQEAEKSGSRRWVLGCGCGFLALILFCVALLFFLDAYQGGQLLYCGPLRPLWEALLGPFGFAPFCL